MIEGIGVILASKLEPHASGLAKPGLGQQVGLAHVPMQRLVFNGARQTDVAAGADDPIVVASKDLRQDRRRGRQVDQRSPDGVVQHLPRGR
jgi:hypothetical protein